MQTEASFDLTAGEPTFKGNSITFPYFALELTEGEVKITYTTQSGADACDAIRNQEESWDLSVTVESDSWGLTDMISAIREAQTLHVALGRNVPFMRD